MTTSPLKSYGRFRVATSIESNTTSSSLMVTTPFWLNSMRSWTLHPYCPSISFPSTVKLRSYQPDLSIPKSLNVKSTYLPWSLSLTVYSMKSLLSSFLSYSLMVFPSLPCGHQMDIAVGSLYKMTSQCVFALNSELFTTQMSPPKMPSLSNPTSTKSL